MLVKVALSEYGFLLKTRIMVHTLYPRETSHQPIEYYL